METAPNTTPATRNGKRRLWLLLILAIVLVVGIAYGLYWWLVLRNYESTDDAYVAGNIIQITPQIAGTVVAVNVNDTDPVDAGTPLVKLDPTDEDVALARAQATLAQTVREVRTLYANNQTLNANINARSADVKRAEDDWHRAEDDYQRRSALATAGAVSREELQHAQNTLDSARNAVAAAKAAQQSATEQLVSSRSLTDGTTIQQHPNVQQAASQVRAAYLSRVRCDIASPIKGFVGRRNVQVGQRIQPGTPLMAVIPLEQVWVEANFKESQLGNMRIGQQVEMTADLYGGKISYHGRIVGFSAGTGAAFSLLPAQNATGNWIKIVQRLPVRIALDADELKSHPLRIGLSMDVEVETKDHDGKLLAEEKQTAAADTTRIFDVDAKAADQLIARIIAENLSGIPRASTSSPRPTPSNIRS
jgi:membrane fusion protein (multidrug efflux system)